MKRTSSRTHSLQNGVSSRGSRAQRDEKEYERPTLTRFRTVFLRKQKAVMRIEPRYRPREVIGAGAYGIVCSAMDLKTQEAVAVKKIENTLEHKSLAKRTLRELIFLRLFDHENIMALKRIMWPSSQRGFQDVYLVNELMETDLACVIRSDQALSNDHVQFFIYQVLRGVKYMHSANVIHRDLKPRNLLVNSNCDLKICDFGLARFDDPDAPPVLSDYVATRWYRSPEIIQQTPRYGKPSDIWACGCILIELLMREPLLKGDNSVHQLTLIKRELGKDWKTALRRLRRKAGERADPLALDLAARMLEWDPRKRITVEECLRHPYLDDLHDEDDEPVCAPIDPQLFRFESQSLSKSDLRHHIYKEIVEHNSPQKWFPSECEPIHIEHGRRPRRRKSLGH